MKRGEIMSSKQFFNKSITEIISNRTSVRNYKAEEISKELKNKLVNYMSNIEGPFNEKVYYKMVDKSNISNEGGGKIGTYGVIKGASSYIIGKVEKGKMDLEQFGYTLEKIILYAASLDLGTCWLGGTFKRSSFENIIDLKGTEILPAVTPIGYIETKKRLLDSVMRLGAGSNNRKEWNELFFNEKFDNPLENNETESYSTALKMVRFAPSASNKQPWRIVKDGNRYHFFIKTNPGYSSALGFNIQRIDIGIAMCHFEMTLTELGENGSWAIDSEVNIKQPENVNYVVTWIGI